MRVNIAMGIAPIEAYTETYPGRSTTPYQVRNITCLTAPLNLNRTKVEITLKLMKKIYW